MLHIIPTNIITRNKTTKQKHFINKRTRQIKNSIQNTLKKQKTKRRIHKNSNTIKRTKNNNKSNR